MDKTEILKTRIKIKSYELKLKREMIRNRGPLFEIPWADKMVVDLDKLKWSLRGIDDEWLEKFKDAKTFDVVETLSVF